MVRLSSAEFDLERLEEAKNKAVKTDDKMRYATQLQRCLEEKIELIELQQSEVKERMAVLSQERDVKEMEAKLARAKQAMEEKEREINSRQAELEAQQAKLQELLRQQEASDK